MSLPRVKLLRDFSAEIQQRIAANYCKNVLVLDECWSWNGTIDKGYARLGISLGAGSKVNLRAHRVSYELFTRPLGRDELVLHMCDNPECTSPLHLVAGTASDNTKDAMSKGRLFVPNPRLGLAKVEAIFLHGETLRKDGATLHQACVRLAEKYDVSHITVRRILTGEHSALRSR